MSGKVGVRSRWTGSRAMVMRQIRLNVIECVFLGFANDDLHQWVRCYNAISSTMRRINETLGPLPESKGLKERKSTTKRNAISEDLVRDVSLSVSHTDEVKWQ